MFVKYITHYKIHLFLLSHIKVFHDTRNTVKCNVITFYSSQISLQSLKIPTPIKTLRNKCFKHFNITFVSCFSCSNRNFTTSRITTEAKRQGTVLSGRTEYMARENYFISKDILLPL